MEQSELATRPSLLSRIRKSDDPDNWREFLDIYYPRIIQWCHDWKLQDADVYDVSQSVVEKLYAAMKTFVYEPKQGKFRGWLKTVTGNVWKDMLAERTRRREVTGGHDGKPDPLESQEARQDLETRLAEQFDLELLEMAKCRVRLRVKPEIWNAFELRTKNGQSPDDVAKSLNITRAKVDWAKSRVQAMLKREVQKLRGGDEFHG